MASNNCEEMVVNSTQTFPTGNNGYTIPASSENSNNINFGVYVVGNNTFEISIYELGVFEGNEAGEEFYSWIDFGGAGTITDACTLKIEHSPLVQFIQADIPPVNQGNTFIEWVFENGNLPEFGCFLMHWAISDDAIKGDFLHWEAGISCPPGLDECPGDNIAIRDIEIISGPLRQMEEVAIMYSTRPQGYMPTIIDNNTTLSYVITFKNPLSTTANNVTIIDTLPDELDIKTISKPFSSFPNHLFQISEAGILTWELNGINLSNSNEDELNSYGFVQFSVQLKENLPISTVIENNATVKFNGIQPSTTNTVIHMFDTDVGIDYNFNSILKSFIFPNPMEEQAVFSLELPDGKPIKYDLEISDLSGQLVRKFEALEQSEIMLKRLNLKSGLYIINAFDHYEQTLLSSSKLVIN